MVLTRSGLKTASHVQFKKNPLSVRRVLEFEYIPNDSALGNSLLDSISTTYIPKLPLKHGILRTREDRNLYTPLSPLNNTTLPNGTVPGEDSSQIRQMNPQNETSFDSRSIVHERESCSIAIIDLLILVFLITGLYLFFTTYDVDVQLKVAIQSLGIIMVSAMFGYFDSALPGRIPPSPFSPSQYRVESGHTYHLGYVMSLVNGLLCYTVLSHIFLLSATDEVKVQFV